jgi:tRNA1Val (adenine37-N6)-methyltransferase
MSNNYFQFKQFTIHQDKTAMKVCTDACLFAAWVANKIEIAKLKIETVLDIGAGTGLLSLMLAQKLDAQIHAVEIDEQTAQQAKENFEASGYSTRLTVYKTSIQNFNPASTYDLIISNPPFYIQSLKSNDQRKNIAKHGVGLSFTELVYVAQQLLKPTGIFSILTPFEEFKTFETIAAEHELHLLQKTDVRHSATHPFFRTMAIFTNQTFGENNYDNLCIRDDKNSYSPAFIELLKDYYLYL